MVIQINGIYISMGDTNIMKAIIIILINCLFRIHIQIIHYFRRGNGGMHQVNDRILIVAREL